MSALHEQAVLQVVDPKAFGAVRSAIDAAFSPARINTFLSALDRAKLRIRDFEDVLAKGILGAPAADGYSRLSNGDQGQIRELYLASLEKVAPDLRSRFFKLYAYY